MRRSWVRLGGVRRSPLKRHRFSWPHREDYDLSHFQHGRMNAIESREFQAFREGRRFFVVYPPSRFVRRPAWLARLKTRKAWEALKPTPAVSRVLCNNCGLWYPTDEIFEIYSSGGKCFECNEGGI